MSGRTDHDVAIVGYGPVGQASAALPGQRGHHVVAVERSMDDLAGSEEILRR